MGYPARGASRARLDEPAVGLRHARMRDDARPPLSGTETLASVSPRIFPVRQITEPLRRPVTVVFQDRVDALPLLGPTPVGIPLLPGLDLELPAMLVVEDRHDRPVRPSFDPIQEEGFLIPDE